MKERPVKEILYDLSIIEKCLLSINEDKKNPWVTRVIKQQKGGDCLRQLTISESAVMNCGRSH